MGIVESTYAELKQQELKNNPYSCLHMADIDINPHQIEAYLCYEDAVRQWIQDGIGLFA